MGVLTMHELSGLGNPNLVYSNVLGKHVDVTTLDNDAPILRRDPAVADAYLEHTGQVELRTELHAQAQRQYGRPTLHMQDWLKTPEGIAWAARQGAAWQRSAVGMATSLARQPATATGPFWPAAPSRREERTYPTMEAWIADDPETGPTPWLTGNFVPVPLPYQYYIPYTTQWWRAKVTDLYQRNRWHANRQRYPSTFAVRPTDPAFATEAFPHSRISALRVRPRTALVPATTARPWVSPQLQTARDLTQAAAQTQPQAGQAFVIRPWSPTSTPQPTTPGPTLVSQARTPTVPSGVVASRSMYVPSPTTGAF
jgi:hypothetical protein